MASEQKESVLDLLKEFNLVTAVSKKTEKPYQVLEIITKGGLESRFFLRDYRDTRDFLKEVEDRTKKDSKFNLED